MGAIKTGVITPPNKANLPLIADIQTFEIMTSSALNRKLRGVLSAGVYSGFQVSVGTGLNVVVSSAGESAAAVKVGTEYLITVKQQHPVTVPVQAGVLSYIALTASYSPTEITNQIDQGSVIKAASIAAYMTGQVPVNAVILASVLVPSQSTSVTPAMISVDPRHDVYFSGFWDRLGLDEIQAKSKWFRSRADGGFLPAISSVRAAAKEFIGTSGAWFKESWVNTYRGGSIDVEGTIKSGGILVPTINNIMATTGTVTVTGNASTLEHHVTLTGVEPVSLVINGDWVANQKIVVTKTRVDSGLLSISSGIDFVLTSGQNAGKLHTLKGAGQFEIRATGGNVFVLTRITGVK